MGLHEREGDFVDELALEDVNAASETLLSGALWLFDARKRVTVARRVSMYLAAFALNLTVSEG